MRGLLRHRDARLYLAGQLLSVFGDTTLWLGVGIWVKQLTGSSSAAGLVFFVFGVGYLTAPLAGLLADRVRRRPLLVATNLVTAPVVLALLLVSDRRQVWLVYVVIGLYGVSGALISSAQSALLTTLVPDELLGSANAVLSTGREALRVLSPLLGAGVVAATGTAKPVAIFDAATFAVAALTLVLLHLREPAPEPRTLKWAGELAAGVRHVWRTVVLRRVVVALAVALFVLGFGETVLFAVVQHGLHRPATFVGVVVSLQGAGSIAGGFVTGWLLRRLGEGRALALGLGLLGAGTGLWLTGIVPGVLVGSALSGVGVPPAFAGFSTVIQRRSPPALQGRAYAAADAVVSVPQTASVGIGAALVLVVDYRLLLVAMAAVEVLCAVWLATRPEQRVPPTPVVADQREVNLSIAADTLPSH